jgi:hypothetical protein
MRSLQSVPAALCRMIIGGAFWLATRLFYSVEFHGLEYDTGAPRTYLAISHRRDLDPIISLPTLLSHRGWRAWAGDIHFALRDDAFSPGYLAHLLPSPRWLSRLLHPLSLGPILRWLGARPLEHLHIRPAEEWIRDVLQIEGDMPCGAVLAPAFVQDLAATAGEPGKHIEESPLSHILSWRYHQVLARYSGPEILIRPTRRHAEKNLLKQVKEHLADLASWLWSGGSLYGAPEGRLSPGGNISPISAALHRLLHISPPDTSIIPVSISYDFMTVQRPRIFVDLAPAIAFAPGLETRQLNAQLRQAWLQSARFTCTHLASSFLLQASRASATSFTLDDLAAGVGLQARSLAETGRHVDQRLLQSVDMHRLAAAFLMYAARHGLVYRTGRDTWKPHLEKMSSLPAGDIISIDVPTGHVGYNQMPLAYAWNDLQDMLNINGTSMLEIASLSSVDSDKQGEYK